MQKYVKLMCWIAIGILIYSFYRLFLRSLNDNNEAFSDKFITIVESSLETNRLVDLNNFKYILDNSLCTKNQNKSILGILIVTSYVGHDSQRAAHRLALSEDKLKSMNFLRVFLLADIPSTEKFISQKQIESEQLRFNDLLQGNFLEAYRNLTYKHVMGLKWASENCGKAKYIIKMDDDTVFDIYSIQNYLINLRYDPGQYLLAGYVLYKKKVIRIKPSKWYVSTKEYELDRFPTYLSGWLYITNRKTAHELVVESESTKFFWIDDTYVTGILAKHLGIRHINLNKWFASNSELIDCCIKDMQKHSLQCDYIVGPNYGDNKMIVEFTKEIEKCNQNACFQRTPENQIKDTCVAQHKRIIQEHGIPLIKEVKL